MNYPSRRGGRYHGWPHPPPLLVALAVLLVVLVAFIEVKVVSTAYTLAGLDPAVAGLVLLASLLGSAVNIPVGSVRGGRGTVRYARVRWFGMTYLVPTGAPGRVTVAVNVGGAVIPTAISAYLLVRSGLWLDAAIATAAVGVVVHLLARPVPGVGIAVPILLPALAATAAALVLHPAHGTGTVAFVCGTLGTLIGADITHLRAIRKLDAPLVSIGGAGTFDGVFLTGILAVLLAAL